MVNPSLRYEDYMHKLTAGSAIEEGKIRRLMMESNLHIDPRKGEWEKRACIQMSVHPLARSVVRLRSDLLLAAFRSICHTIHYTLACSCTVQVGRRGTG